MKFIRKMFLLLIMVLSISNVNALSKKIDKTGVTTIRLYSNGKELGNTEKIKTSDVLIDNSTEYLVAVLGDSNKDGVVDISDLSRTYRIYKNQISVSKVERMATDSNKDDKIDISDLSRTYRIYKNQISDDGDYVPPAIIEYTIAFNSNGGSAVQPIKRNSGSSIGTLPTPTKSGYTFDGWYTSSSGGTKISTSTKVTGNVTYYAVWTINKFTVTFDSNGGSAVNSIKRSYGEKLGTLPVPTKKCSSFGGWYYKEPGSNMFFENNKINANTLMPNNNVTYYAFWNEDVEREQNYCCFCDSSTGMKRFNDGKYRYVVNHIIQTGWINYSDEWYYADSTGTLKTGWQTIDGKKYYFDSEGIMQRNCFIEGYWLTDSGAWDNGPKSSWYKGSNGKWWYGYQDQSWYAKSNSYRIDGKNYSFDYSGYCSSGC